MNSKSILHALLRTAMALCLAAQPLFAATFGKFSYIDDGIMITITGYDRDAVGTVAIPASIAGKRVTSIADGAFTGCPGLTSVTIPNSVTSIGNRAFNYCTGLSGITIPNSVTFIGAFAFDACIALTSVTIPDSVTSIGNGTFAGCWGLTSVTIPNSVTSIGQRAFWKCVYSLNNVTIPASVTSIGFEAFSDCYNLAGVIFLGNAPALEAPESSVFAGCYASFRVYYLKGKTGFTQPTWNGYPAVAIKPAPEIDVQQPLRNSLEDGAAKKSFGTTKVGKTGRSKTFTIKNTGTASLKGLSITLNGMQKSDFIATSPAMTSLAPGASTTFKVAFKPTATGTRNAAIRIKSNDADENPFDIKLTGHGAAK